MSILPGQAKLSVISGCQASIRRAGFHCTCFHSIQIKISQSVVLKFSLNRHIS